VGHVLWILFGPDAWGTGGNLVAWVLCGALGVGGAFLFRDLIGRRLAAWWHRHHRRHLAGELDAMEQRLKAHIDTRHQELTEQVTSKGRRA
jgi:hypothetical protein